MNQSTAVLLRFGYLQSRALKCIKLKIFPVPVRLHSGTGKLIFVIISPCFAIFKNVVHSLEPGETPGSKLCTTFLNIAKHIKTVAVRLRLFFSIYLICSVLYLIMDNLVPATLIIYG